MCKPITTPEDKSIRIQHRKQFVVFNPRDWDQVKRDGDAVVAKLSERKE